jgi:hypothetical protein
MSKRFRRIPFAFGVLLAALAAPIPTSGQASVQTTTIRVPFEGAADLPCVGQVWVSGVYHQTESTRIDSAAGSHYVLRYALTQLRANDANGNEWTGIHVGQRSFNPNFCASPDCGAAPFETTWVQNLLLVGAGTPDLRLTTRLRAVVNANGEGTVLFNVTDVTCSS